MSRPRLLLSEPATSVDVSDPRGLTDAPVLVVTAVVVATAVGGVALGVHPAAPPVAALDLAVDPATDRITLVHRGGDRLDVREIDLSVRVDSRPLRRQPPVPFFAVRGFRAGPTGPFNVRADPAWTPGERASLRLAATNTPLPHSGSRVTVVVTAGGRTVGRASVRV